MTQDGVYMHVCVSVCMRICVCLFVRMCECVCPSVCLCILVCDVLVWCGLLFIIPLDSGDILIASSGQDMFVRVWRLSKEQTRDPSAADDELKVKKNSFTVSLQGNNQKQLATSERVTVQWESLMNI